MQKLLIISYNINQLFNFNQLFNKIKSTQLMLIKSIFDPIDRLIDQAKGFLVEQDIRKKYYQQIEDKINTLKPELERRKEELIILIDKIDSDEILKEQLQKSIDQLNSFLDNIELVAEKELALAIMPLENQESFDQRQKSRDDYVNHQLLKLQEQINLTNNFFEVADFANEIWADFDLFEETNKHESIVQVLVDRMNETNTKNTETRLGKDLKKTIEHIRLNLVKSTSWTENEIISYQRERDIKINQLQPISLPSDKNYQVLFFGGVPEVIAEIGSSYLIPSKLKIDWVDIEDEEVMEQHIKNTKNDLAIIFSMFPNHRKFVTIKEKLVEEKIPYSNVISFSAKKFVKSLEDELLKVSFQDHFSKK